MFWGCDFKPPNLLEVRGKFPKKQLWHHPVFLQWEPSCSAPPCEEEESGRSHLPVPSSSSSSPAPSLHQALLFLHVFCYLVPMYKWHRLLLAVHRMPFLNDLFVSQFIRAAAKSRRLSPQTVPGWGLAGPA